MFLYLLCQRRRLLKALLTNPQLRVWQVVTDNLSPGCQLCTLNLVSENPARL